MNASSLFPEFQLPKPLPDELLVHLVGSLLDPVEVMRFAEDYYTFGARVAQRQAARALGRPLPSLPRPRSLYMRKFLAWLVGKIAALAIVLTPDELERLGHIAPELFRRVGEGDGELTRMLAELVDLPPGPFADWIREHLPMLETRLAS